MFLVEDRRPGLHNFVFTALDPRQDGYAGNVIEGVSLDYDPLATSLWPPGTPRPRPQLGRDRADPKRYKVFKSGDELRAADYEPVHPGVPFVFPSWRDYREALRVPAELAEKLESDEWFDFVDAVDAAEKQRRQRDVNPEPPEGSDLDRIAEWVARQHLAADGSIRQVLYLPKGAPPDEIRLIEVNDRIVRDFEKAEPFTFGNEIAGRRLDVSVADVSGDQLEAIRRGSLRLPDGWSLDGAVVIDGWRTRSLTA